MQVIIPLYNAHSQVDNLDNILQRNSNLAKLNFLLVDDCSPIELKQKLIAISNKYSNVHFIRLKQNVGIHISTYVGIMNANEEMILTLDQDFIPLLPELSILISQQDFNLEKLHYFIIEKQRSFFRDFSSTLTLCVVNFFGGYNLKGIYSIRFFNRKHIKHIKINKWFILDLALGLPNQEVEYIKTDISIFKKQSTISFTSLIKIFLKIMFAYTYIVELLLMFSVLIFFFWNKQVFAFTHLFILAVFILFKSWVKNFKINIKPIVEYD